MNTYMKYIGWALVGIVVIAALALLLIHPRQSSASAPLGFATTLATTSTLQVGPQSMVMLFASSTACTTRVVSTVNKAIMVSYSTSSMTATGAIGNVQAASTTVAYDGGLYGCGAWGAYGFDSSTTITVSELR